MKLTHSIVVIAALTSMSFAGGMIMEPAVENEEPYVPVEPVPAPEPLPLPLPVPDPKPDPKPIPVPVPKPVEPKPVPVVAKPLGLYIAGGVTDVGIRPNGKINLFKKTVGQDRQVGITGRLGYDFMDFLGAELRGTYGIAKDAPSKSKFKQVGGYLKPNYDVTDAINLYGLLGASKTNYGVGSTTGFSYGAGLDYGISDKVSVFTDVVNYMAKSKTAAQWGLTLGAAYQF